MERVGEAVQHPKTILVTDDAEEVLAFVSGLLIKANYSVLRASGGANALAVAKAYPGEISLLLSDFQMPGMSGVELATKLIVDRPNLQVLLMSGFPDGMLVLNEGWHFMAKPFVTHQLLGLINGLLNPHVPVD